MGIALLQDERVPDYAEASPAGEKPKVLLTRDQIQQRVAELGAQLTKDYAGKTPLLVAVLQGAAVFFADLIRQLDLEIRCDFISVSSYAGDAVPRTKPQLLVEPGTDWKGQHVVLVEAIVDTGKTAELLAHMAAERGAATARLCTLLDKPSRRQRPVICDYVGFTIEDHFVVGYGLDYRGYARNLSYIGIAAA